MPATPGLLAFAVAAASASGYIGHPAAALDPCQHVLAAGEPGQGVHPWDAFAPARPASASTTYGTGPRSQQPLPRSDTPAPATSFRSSCPSFNPQDCEAAPPGQAGPRYGRAMAAQWWVGPLIARAARASCIRAASAPVCRAVTSITIATLRHTSRRSTVGSLAAASTRERSC